MPLCHLMRSLIPNSLYLTTIIPDFQIRIQIPSASLFPRQHRLFFLTFGASLRPSHLIRTYVLNFRDIPEQILPHRKHELARISLGQIPKAAPLDDIRSQ